MASSPVPDPRDAQAPTAVREFASLRYEDSGACQFGMEEAELTAVLTEIVKQRPAGSDETDFLTALRLEELVLARACANGNERAWEVFLTRYRNTLYETAYKIAKIESVARSLADSLYAELYGVDSKGQQRNSKLRSYQGRGSLQGWLRMVIAQAYVNHYRSIRRETSLDAVLEDGAQFAAREPEVAVADPRVDAAVSAELAALEGGERFLMAAYYLDHRTLAEIAKLQGVHESTISRKLERAVKGVRKRIVKRLVQLGMDVCQAVEAMEGTDVRDLRVKVGESLRQEMPETAFYKEKGEPQG